jgi:hypothetical protein
MSEAVGAVDSAGGVDALAGLVAAMRDLSPTADDASRIDRIRLLEELRSVTAAMQAVETAAFVASQRDRNLAAGVPAERAEQGVAHQVGMARRMSPWQAQRYVGWVKTVLAELPARPSRQALQPTQAAPKAIRAIETRRDQGAGSTRS